MELLDLLFLFSQSFLFFFLTIPLLLPSSFFFFNDTATTEIYTLSLHDALPISLRSHLPESPVIRRPSRLPAPRAPFPSTARIHARPDPPGAPRRRPRAPAPECPARRRESRRARLPRCTRRVAR